MNKPPPSLLPCLAVVLPSANAVQISEKIPNRSKKDCVLRAKECAAQAKAAANAVSI